MQHNEESKARNKKRGISMEELFHQILQSLESGEDAVLVTIIEGSDSIPRSDGTSMLIRRRQGPYGTIGGSRIEHDAVMMAQELLAAKRSHVHACRRLSDLAPSDGLVCGGDMTLHFQYIPAEEHTVRFYRTVLDLCQSGWDFWLVTRIQPDGSWGLCAYDGDLHPAACCGDFSADARSVLPLLTENKGLYREDGVLFFVLPVRYQGQAYVFGSGHLACELVPVLKRARFSCTVVDCDDSYATPQNFPDAREIIITPFEHVIPRLAVSPRDYLIIMSRGHQSDYQILRQVLATPARYIGMIGSQKKINSIFLRLIREDGYSYADVKRVHAPIGLPIGGEHPSEIAIAIAAELIQERYRKV